MCKMYTEHPWYLANVNQCKMPHWIDFSQYVTVNIIYLYPKFLSVFLH